MYCSINPSWIYSRNLWKLSITLVENKQKYFIASFKLKILFLSVPVDVSSHNMNTDRLYLNINHVLVIVNNGM